LEAAISSGRTAASYSAMNCRAAETPGGSAAATLTGAIARPITMTDTNTQKTGCMGIPLD